MNNIITCRNCWANNGYCQDCQNKNNLEIELKNAKEAERFMLDMGKVFLALVTGLVIISIIL